jgi:hypothetical protein
MLATNLILATRHSLRSPPGRANSSYLWGGRATTPTLRIKQVILTSSQRLLRHRLIVLRDGDRQYLVRRVLSRWMTLRLLGFVVDHLHSEGVNPKTLWLARNHARRLFEM